MTQLYFAYGSNMLTARLRRRLPSTRFYAQAIARGYELAFAKRGDDGSAKCTITPKAGAVCHGVVFRIDAQERPILDRIEGLGHGYQGLELGVELCDRSPQSVSPPPESGPVEVFCYMAQVEWVDYKLRPFDWYQRLVALGAREHGVPQGYLDMIEAEPHTVDTNANRRAEAAAIFDLLRVDDFD